MKTVYILFITFCIAYVKSKRINSYEESYEKSFEKRRDSNSVEVSNEANCPKDSFLWEADNKCHPCSRCGPDLYILEECTPDEDTVCDWCYSPTATKNRDFKLKCGDVQLKSIFRVMVKAQREEPVQDDSYEIFARDEERMKEVRRWAAAASIAKFGFYFLLTVLIAIVIRYVRKSKQAYRTITLMPPMLDEHDSKDIIRAADHIREKLGKKGYNRLEEYV